MLSYKSFSVPNNKDIANKFHEFFVNPLHKKGDSTQLGNYRPNSLLPSISKVFEKVVYLYYNSP